MVYSSNFFKACNTLLITASLLMIGCSDSKNSPPEAVIQGVSQAPEKSTVTLLADATDSEGDALSFHWSLPSESNITISNESNDVVSLHLPEVGKDTEILVSLTVTDTHGASMSTTHNLVIKSNRIKVSLDGVVIGGPVENTQVEAEIAGTVFSTTVVSDGSYILDIDMDDEFASSPVKLTANGDLATNPKLEFVSNVGTLSELALQAGEDEVLSGNENRSVNITSFSTVASIADNSAKEILNIAAYLELIVDPELGDLTLPNGIKTTLELLNDKKALGEFIGYYGKTNSQGFYKAIDKIKRAQEAIASVSNKFNFVDQLLLTKTNLLSNSAWKIEVNENNTGDRKSTRLNSSH